MKIKANLFKELSNKNTPIEIEAGQEVGRAFGEIDTENAVFIINGKEVKPDYILQPNDIVTVRLLPSAATTAVIVAVAVVAVGAAVVGGVALYKAKKAKDQAKEEMEKMKKLSNSPTVDNRPFLRGATNSIALGNSQVYAMGRNFFTPYLHCAPFYRLAGTDGETQFVYHSVECGFNSQVFVKIGIDDIVIKSFSDTTPQQGGFALDGGQVFADGVGEISQNGEELKTIPELNYKVVSLPQNEEVKRDAAVTAGRGEYFTATLPPNAATVDVAITFPAGLWAYNDNNDKVATSCTVTPQYSLDGGQSWKDFTFDNNGTMTNTFTRNEPTKELRYNAHYDFTENDYAELKAAGQGVIIVRVRSNGAEDSKVKNDVYVLFIQSVIFDPNKSSKPAGILDDGGFAGLVPCKVVEDRERKYCTILGLKIKATRNNEDKLKRINIISISTARVWDGAKWSTDKRPTRNLAALLLELLTSHTHPTSRIDDAELDLESFGDAFTWCENNGYMYDAVITSGMKKRDIIAQMLTACGGVLYRDILGRYAVAMDRPQENALAVFNAQNIVSITNKKGFQRRTDGLRLHYINSQNDLYKEDTYLLMREVNGQALPITPDSIIKDVNLQGVTTFNHVVKYGFRLMAIEALRPKVTTIEIGNEGIFYTPLSKVLIQDDSLKNGLSNHVIKSVIYNDGKITHLIIDGFVNFEEGKRYGVIINSYDESGGVISNIEVRGSGRTNRLIVDSTSFFRAVPEAGNTLSFGELEADGSFDKVATPYIIQSIARRGSRFILDLVNYNEAIFDVGTIPDYVSNITEKPAPAPAIPPLLDGRDGKDGANGESGLTVFIEKSALVYQADAQGNIEEWEQTARVHVEQNGVPVPFKIGEIESPAGFAVWAVGKVVHIKALAGSSMAKDGVIKIPLTYRKLLNDYEYINETKDVYIDDNGEIYADFELAPEETKYNIYVSYAKSIRGEQGSAYRGQDLPALPNKGDTRLDPERCILTEWNGTNWVDLPISDPRYYQAMADIIATIDKAGEGQMQIANAWVKNLVTGTILAESIFTKELTMREQGILKSDNFIDKEGFKTGNGYYLEANGLIQSNNIVLSSDVSVPLIELNQYALPYEYKIELKQENVKYIKTWLDEILDSKLALNLNVQDSTSRQVFCHITSLDPQNLFITPYGYAANSIVRQTNNGVVEYLLLGGYDKQGRGNRVIIRGDNIVASELSNYFIIKTRAGGVRVRAPEFRGVKISSTMGYRYQSINSGKDINDYTQNSYFLALINAQVDEPLNCLLQYQENGWQFIPAIIYKTSTDEFTVVTNSTTRRIIKKGSSTKLNIQDKIIIDIFV